MFLLKDDRSSTITTTPSTPSPMFLRMVPFPPFAFTQLLEHSASKIRYNVDNELKKRFVNANLPKTNQKQISSGLYPMFLPQRDTGTLILHGSCDSTDCRPPTSVPCPMFLQTVFAVGVLSVTNRSHCYTKNEILNNDYYTVKQL
uniref:Peptidase S1 domain-containing protein n=1 Tax=Panagrellus redivivus TaxID=6233 RepID=A0A7E4W4N3_PANRE